VRKLIARHGLVAPDDACAQWPFRLRVRVLGAFELVRDGEPVRFTGKTQQRPLELLKFVAAAGSTGVDADHVTSALWPDADGAAAKSSFDSALFRLRKLLDVDDAIELASGQLTLRRSIVWTTCWRSKPRSSMRARLTRGLRSPRDDSSMRMPDRSSARTKARGSPSRATCCARGSFESLMELGAALEGAGDWIAAADVYRRGLEADNLVEPFYRGLMRALVATGSPSEALAAFRRCRELLSIVLGLEPSPETQRLYRDIVRDAKS
jgi:DNA-binding SARP family transcriptional activator